MLISMIIVTKSKRYIPPPTNSENSGGVLPKGIFLDTLVMSGF